MEPKQKSLDASKEGLLSEDKLVSTKFCDPEKGPSVEIGKLEPMLLQELGIDLSSDWDWEFSFCKESDLSSCEE